MSFISIVNAIIIFNNYALPHISRFNQITIPMHYDSTCLVAMIPFSRSLYCICSSRFLHLPPSQYFTLTITHSFLFDNSLTFTNSFYSTAVTILQFK